LVPKTEKVRIQYKDKNGNTRCRYHYRKVSNGGESGDGGGYDMEMKFSKDKLRKMNIEDILDLFMAEQLGHKKTDTNNEYRSIDGK
jgi:hypothetical protein